MSGKDDIPDVGTVVPGKKTSPITFEPAEPVGDAGQGDGQCWFNDVQYAQGDEICSARTRFICQHNGTWAHNGSD